MTPRVRLVTTIGLLVATLLTVRLYSHGEAVPLRRSLDRFPETVGGWQAREATLLGDEVLNLLQVKDYLVRRYVDAAGHDAWLYIGYHETQRRGAQFHSPRNCLPGAGWEAARFDRVRIAVPGPAGGIVVNRYLVQKDREQRLVVYWYQVRGQAIASEWRAKVEMVRGALSRNRTDGALIRIASPLHGSLEQTFALHVGLVQALHPALGEFLPD